jgi:hypothetical protein
MISLSVSLSAVQRNDLPVCITVSSTLNCLTSILQCAMKEEARLRSADRLHYVARCVGQDSSVFITHRYKLQGPQIESRGGGRGVKRCCAPVQAGCVGPLCGPHSLLYNGYCVSLPRTNRSGRGFDHPPHLATRLKKEYSYTSTPTLDHHGLF